MTIPAESSSLATRLGILMTLMGIWHLARLVRFGASRLRSGSPRGVLPANPAHSGEPVAELLLAVFLIAVGVLGPAVGSTSPTWTEVGLEIVMVAAGTEIFTREMRRSGRRTEAKMTRAV